MAGGSVTLTPDRRGVAWDALLYVPTCAGLGIGAIAFWYNGSHSLSYLLLFLTCFFLFQGVHRVLARLMLLPSSPVRIDVTKQRVAIDTRRGQRIELVKDVRYFADYAGKSFGLTGMDLNGAKKQFVFHRGQFVAPGEFQRVAAMLKVYA